MFELVRHSKQSRVPGIASNPEGPCWAQRGLSHPSPCAASAHRKRRLRMLVAMPLAISGLLHLIPRRFTTADISYLQTGIDRGYFSVALAKGEPAAMPRVAANATVLAVAAEMASAMAYLHGHRIVHGDLCGTNILLTTDKSKPHGFTSKVQPRETHNLGVQGFMLPCSSDDRACFFARSSRYGHSDGAEDPMRSGHGNLVLSKDFLSC